MPVTLMPAPVAAHLLAADLTYAEAGATAVLLPRGYHHLRRTVAIGAGAEGFTAAADALMSWQVHARAGLRVSASALTAERDSVLELSLGPRALRIAAPCRVVYVIDEPDRRGFAYGTLPGHPERGEEAFVVSRGPDVAVTFTVTAFSRPASALAMLAGPLGRAVQSRITGRYLEALSR